MTKRSTVPGFPLALRQLADEAERIIENAPYASKISSYCDLLRVCLEDVGFVTWSDSRGQIDIAARKRGYVIVLKVGRTRLSSRTLEAFADYRADYRMVVLRDWNINEEPRRSLSGIDQVITPFLGEYNAKTSFVKHSNGSAKNTNNHTVNTNYKEDLKNTGHKQKKNTKKPAIFLPPVEVRVRARKSLREITDHSSTDHGATKISLLTSFEEENLCQADVKDFTQTQKQSSVRFANQNSRSRLAVGEPLKNYKKLDPNRMRAAHQQARQVRRAANAHERSRFRGRRCRIDWSELDQTGRPVLSFEPDDTCRPPLLKILERDARDRTRQAVVRKLGVEFSRIYERYRAACNRRDGRLGSVFRTALLSDKHRRYCEEIGVLCIELAVTPRALLEFWDKNIKDFTDGQVTVPPLAFLKSASAIDRVACSNLGTVGTSNEGRPRVGKTAADRNPYADLSRFDVRLRRMLEEAGFDTTRYNDRYLLSVQHNAVAVARGSDLLLVPGQFGDMIRVAADWYREQFEAEASDARG